MKSLRDNHTDATIAALLHAGRQRFGRQGYEATSLEEIAADARVTTGAIYHHFAGKKGLLRAVAETVEAELLAIALQAEGDTLWERTHRAFEALIDACATAEVQRIIFLDAPRIIGLEAWREIELRYAFGGMSAALAQMIAEGTVNPYPVSLIAPVLLATLAETSRAVALDPAARHDAVALMGDVLGALRMPELSRST